MSFKFASLVMRSRAGALVSVVDDASDKLIKSAKEVRTSGKFGKVEIDRGIVFNNHRIVFKFRCEKPVKVEKAPKL